MPNIYEIFNIIMNYSYYSNPIENSQYCILIINSGSKTNNTVHRPESKVTDTSPPKEKTTTSGLPTSVSSTVSTPESDAPTNETSKEATPSTGKISLQSNFIRSF